LGVTSESSYRFERGVDPDGVERASARAAQLMVELAGGTVRDVTDVGPHPSSSSPIALEVDRLNRWLGTSLTPGRVRGLLARLSCRVAAVGRGALLRVTVPSYRRDLRQPADLYEEIARLIGYDRIPPRLPVVPIVGSAHPGKPVGLHDEWCQVLRTLCVSLGLNEVVTWSLVAEADLLRYQVPVEQAVRLSNPLSQDHAYLRPSLVIGLVDTVRRNLTQGASGVGVFEVGTVLSRDSALVPSSRSGTVVPVHQPQRLGMALSGLWMQDWRTRLSCDFFHLKGLLETLILRVCGISPTMERMEASWAEPRHATRLIVPGLPLGVAGLVSRRVTEALDLPHAVWFAELAVEALFARRRQAQTIHALPLVPPVKRDLSVLVSDDTSCAALLATIREVGGEWMHRVELIDRYTGDPVPSGQHSLTFSLHYRDPSRTLTADEVDRLHQRIAATLADRFHVSLR
jgi:phenylalanyl-tRNA synthetase beta chain